MSAISTERRSRAPADRSGSIFVTMTSGQRSLVLGMFGAYLAVVLLLRATTAGSPSIVVFLSLVVFVALRVAPIALFRESYGWFHPLVFGALFSVITLLRKAPVYIWGMEYHSALPGYTPSELANLVVLELGLSSLGLLAYYFGFFMFPRIRLPRLPFAVPRVVPIRVMGLVLLSALAFGLIVRSRGGLAEHVLLWGLSRRVANEGISFGMGLVRIGAWACIMWLIVDRGALRNALFWTCSTISLFIVFSGSGSRGTLLAMVAMGLIAWMLSRQRIAYGRVMVAGIVGIFLLGALGEFRAATRQQNLDFSVFREHMRTTALIEVVRGQLVSRATTGHGVYPILAQVPHEVDFLYGASYVAVATIWVPRRFWPEKPGLSDGRVGQTFFGTPAGKPPSPVGEAYWNFGISGVILVYLIFGMFHKLLVAFYQSHSETAAGVLIYVTALWMIPGPAGTSVVSFFLQSVSLFLMLLAMGGLPRRRVNAAHVGISG